MTGTVNCSWIDAPSGSPAPADNGITIWYSKVNDLSDRYDEYYQLIAPEEKTKAERFHREADRQRYVIQHGLLRKLLGDQLGISGDELTFNFGPNKKPYLSGHDIYFNLSNSDGEFLIAIAQEEMGLDIEIIKPNFNYQDIAQNYFGKDEIAFIDRSDDPAKAFFLLWTRKEALLKACGMGIDDDLPQVPALDGKHNLPARYPVKEWRTQSFCLEDQTMISLTYPGEPIQINLTALNSYGF
ncbi:4'-phosphopantetheinyl transferase family protein [Mucilaginibacter myungsuensis]|uniref:4'-phosphopantetheinyl transferase superfamily protein n=1 Tax=Mucilaginibacter myungsuensis TaxID=649104 RepID=A0A929L0V4_9SPHI|nr:4'-phosphopantetheinyl transferase superfamily protein [Mucilaginibacter myungsuensis]MBE9662070.1 4'-phosphopantetheinyl transferase superfamily protein [Mucilaginibacter myungsuensis]MDN3599496.1 4'-phosphopantetheinyl transferase superfamily protein [Mucilaginibacter myungsuensis]